MIATIRKDFAFSAAHHLRGLDPDHQCARPHGHNYQLRVELTGHVTEPGFVLDYGDLGQFGKWVDATLDHRDLNSVVTFNPTSEYLSRWLLGVVRDNLPDHAHLMTIAVELSETPKTWCRYEEKW